MRLIIADDFGPLRRALADLIDYTEGLELAGEATNVEETLLLMERVQPDVVILNDNMPPYDSLEIVPRLLEKRPESCILMISMEADSERARKALAAGVKAYLLKQQLYQDFVPAVWAVGRGESYISAEVEALLAQEKRQDSGTSSRTSPAESSE
jgi:DNA-binding NarL/FixJ family response regulator